MSKYDFNNLASSISDVHCKLKTGFFRAFLNALDNLGLKQGKNNLVEIYAAIFSEENQQKNKEFYSLSSFLYIGQFSQQQGQGKCL